MQEHEKLLAALRRGDAAAARVALEADIGAAAAHIEQTGQLKESD
jgi:DNA-binding GntR family transcriptional regulator